MGCIKLPQTGDSSNEIYTGWGWHQNISRLSGCVRRKVKILKNNGRDVLPWCLRCILLRCRRPYFVRVSNRITAWAIAETLTFFRMHYRSDGSVGDFVEVRADMGKRYKITATITKPGHTPAQWQRYQNEKMTHAECEKLFAPAKEPGRYISVRVEDFRCEEVKAWYENKKPPVEPEVARIYSKSVSVWRIY